MREPVERNAVRRQRQIVPGKDSEAWDPYIFCRDNQLRDFCYTDLNAIMAAVRTWM